MKFLGEEVINMDKIEEIKEEKIRIEGEIAAKLNEVIKTVNNFIYTEKEEPIYETLNINEVLVISKDKEGVLVASNHLGVVQLERVKYPKEGED